MVICDTCIMAIKSRGEKIYVGDSVHDDNNESMTCEWCKDEFDELNEVRV